MHLIFDTETTGLPLDWSKPSTDLENWPRIVQLSWMLIDDDGRELSVNDFIIKPNGFEIPEKSSAIHGITTDIANNSGIEISRVLMKFKGDLALAETLVAHNIKFDISVLKAELRRDSSFDNRINLGVCLQYLGEMKKSDTMMASIDLCALPGPYGFKWPKLDELHDKLFGSSFDGAHNALFDTRACAKCFVELKKRNLI